MPGQGMFNCKEFVFIVAKFSYKICLIFHGEVLEVVVFYQELPQDQELDLRQVCELIYR